ncbi:hypothetical protein JW977_04425 [Candidatus Falkowbacteria bacterium]|nr:hypothetical protein [Candidatus Falkowbacteria bacterium]
MNLEDLQIIENKMGEIKELLNPVDAAYICDAIVSNLKDEMLSELVMDMMLKMGYKNKKILEVAEKVRQIQS